MTKRIKYVGLDVHKISITIAIADEGRDQQVRKYGAFENKPVAIDKFVRKLVSDGSTPHNTKYRKPGPFYEFINRWI